MLRDISNHVEELCQFVSVFDYTFVILVTMSQVSLYLHLVVDWEAVVKQLIVKIG